MKSGPVPLFLAPMAGVSDLAYRILARECGADFTVTEFTAAAGLSRHASHSWLKVESHPLENPFIPQIFGGVTEEMVKTVKLLQKKANIIDINFGCPAPKVCRNDAGAALLRNPDKIVKMVRACLDVAEVPISVKVRLGTGTGPNTALEVAQRLEREGIYRICVHGRTLKQRYSGLADWEQIREIVDGVEIPVIANGDVVDSASTKLCMDITKSAGLMIGRGAIGMPNIFYDIKRDLGWNTSLPPWKEDNPAAARLWCWKRYLDISKQVYGEKMNKNIKRHAISFTKGLPGASAMRVQLHSVTTQEELGKRVSQYLENLNREELKI